MVRSLSFVSIILNLFIFLFLFFVFTESDVQKILLFPFFREIIMKVSILCRHFIYQLRRISSDAGMPVMKDPFMQRYVQGMDNVEPLFRQLRAERLDLQLIMVVLPGKTPVYGKGRGSWEREGRGGEGRGSWEGRGG